MKCWVLMHGCGYREDGEYHPVRVFLDAAQANDEYAKLQAIMCEFGESHIGGMKHAERMILVAAAEVEAPKRYAAIGYDANTHSWWELFEDVDLIARREVGAKAA